MERIQVRTAQKELENRASQFLIDNESERAYLPWCVIASRLDRHGHHTRQIYTNFCRCSDELQTEIFKQANLSKDGHAYAEEIPKWVELLRTDILNLQLGFDVLYDGAKYFHRSFLRYRDNCWDSTTKAKIFNSIADHTYMLIGRFSECNQLDLLSYIDEYFYYFLASNQGATMEISPLPPVDYVWSNQNLGYRVVDEADIKKKQKAAIMYINQKTGEIVQNLDAEHPEDPVEFLIKDLTLKVKNASGRDDYLWEIGSASNWLAYHVATILAFQQFFQTRGSVSVPNFVIFDQPSQVYFPQLKQQVIDEEKQLPDEDKLAVKKIFSAMSSYLKTTDCKVQIIVTEHADEDIWGDVENVHLVERWRGNDLKLVPVEWLS